MISPNKAERAASLLGFDGLIFDVTIARQALAVVGRVRPGELKRRQEHALDPVTDRQVLAALFTLPYGIPVPSTSVPWEQRIVLDAAPAGLVAVTGDALVRTYRPVIDPVGILVGARTVDDLTRVGPFASVAPRAAVINQREVDLLSAEVAERDLGLIVQLPSGDLALAAAARRSRVRSGWRRWKFSEVLLGEVLRNRPRRFATLG